MNEEEDQRITAWHKVASHPFFQKCYDEDATLIEAMLNRLDAFNRWLEAQP